MKLIIIILSCTLQQKIKNIIKTLNLYNSCLHLHGSSICYFYISSTLFVCLGILSEISIFLYVTLLLFFLLASIPKIFSLDHFHLFFVCVMLLLLVLLLSSWKGRFSSISQGIDFCFRIKDALFRSTLLESINLLRLLLQL